MARICMIAFTYYSSDPRVRREAEALAGRGDDVDCICLREPGQEKVGNLNGVRLFPLSISRYRGASTIFYLTTYCLFFWSAFCKLAVLHLKKRYDVVQVHTMPDFLVFVALIPKMLGAKVILDVHDLMPELYMSKFGIEETSWVIRFITWLERRSIAFAHRAIAVHKLHLEALIKHGNPEEKFDVLLNVPDPRIFVRQPRTAPRGNHTFRLMYHGTVAKRSGIDVALRAVARARTEIADLEFHIVGEGDELQRIVHLAAELQLDGCVRFHQRVPVEQLPALITQAEVGIVPYLNDQFTRYQLPVKLLEYVALGKPVIVSRTETLEAYFDDHMVRYCHSGNEVELANHIVDLHQNPQKGAQLVANADKFNTAYNWQDQKVLYFKLIDSLLSVSYSPAAGKKGVAWKDRIKQLAYLRR